MTNDIKADLNWWIFFLQHYNGTSVIPAQLSLTDTALFATDACLLGCGAVCYNEYFHHSFPLFVTDMALSINALELLTIVVAFKIWHSKLAGTDVTVFCDNSSCVYAINSKRSHSHFMQLCLRELWFYLSLASIRITARSISGRHNTLADLLSRWDLSPTHSATFNDLTIDKNLTEVKVEDSAFHCLDL
jgi:hypothetical protein